MNIPWACPKCGAPANNHGKGNRERCRARGLSDCPGFLCECDGDTDDHHGEQYADPCPEAKCHHCGWSGTFPMPPKKAAPWEKKALAAGWTPPEARRKELLA